MRNLFTLLLLAAICLPIYSKSFIGSDYGVSTLSEALRKNIPIVYGSEVSIKGNFSVDINFDFYGVEIDMDPNSITLIKPNIQTAFYDSHIFCSKGMWSGISTYGQITVSECFIILRIQINRRAMYFKVRKPRINRKRSTLP